MEGRARAQAGVSIPGTTPSYYNNTVYCVCVCLLTRLIKAKKMCAAAGRGRGSRRAGGQIGRILDQRQGLISPLGPCYCACCSAGYPCSLVGFIEPNLSAPRSQPPTSPINDPSTAPASLGGRAGARGAHNATETESLARPQQGGLRCQDARLSLWSGLWRRPDWASR